MIEQFREESDHLRHELAILFAQNLAGDKLPPGLAIGLGIYAEDPALTFERRLSAAPPPAEAPSMSWRGLWEAPDVIAHPDLKAAIVHCEKVGDYVSRELLEDILESEEEHIDFLETQLQLIDRVGLPNYCQSQMKAAS